MTARAYSLYSSLVPTDNEDEAVLTAKQVSFNDRQWYIIADNSDGNGEGTVTIDGRKLHQSKKDLEQQKVFTNNLCRERELHVAEKGYHFDGTPIESGEIITWNVQCDNHQEVC